MSSSSLKRKLDASGSEGQSGFVGYWSFWEECRSNGFFNIWQTIPRSQYTFKEFLNHWSDKVGSEGLQDAPGLVQLAHGNRNADGALKVFSPCGLGLLLWEFEASSFELVMRAIVKRDPVPPDAITMWESRARCIYSFLHADDASFVERDLRPLTIDECVAKLALIVAESCGVCINEDLANDIIAPICSRYVEPCAYVAKTVVRTKLMEDLVGTGLLRVVRDHVFRSDAGLPDREVPAATADVLLQELVATRAQLARLKQSAFDPTVSISETDIGGECLVLVPPRAPAKPKHNVCINADFVRGIAEYVASFKAALRHIPKSLVAAEVLVKTLKGESLSDAHSTAERLVASSTMGRYCVLLDEALDMHFQERINQAP